jgi:transcriptional regulator with XRE-family HTH domain
MRAGESLRLFRSRAGLTTREVAEFSQRIAQREGNDELSISHARMIQIENDASTPSVHKLFSLSIISSGDTSKPASRGHLKTGQLSASRTVIVLPHRWHFRQEFFKLNLPSAPNSVYTDLTWAEDRATQGCDPSADPAAGMAGRRQPPQKRTAILAENAVNPRGLGTASPTEESLLPIWFCSREIEWSHIHCGAPAAAVAVFVRQLRGPHLSTCP